MDTLIDQDEYAIERCYPDILDHLMQHAYNRRDEKVKWNISFLRCAIIKRSVSCLSVLLRWGIKYTPQPGLSLLHSAAFSGQPELVKLLVEFNPWCLQDNFLVNHNIPSELEEADPSFTAELIEAQRQPLRLDVLCRAKIHEQLGFSLVTKAEYLQLPRSLNEFVQLKNNQLF